jgi:hypothetical protein
MLPGDRKTRPSSSGECSPSSPAGKPVAHPQQRQADSAAQCTPSYDYPEARCRRPFLATQRSETPNGSGPLAIK